MPTRSFRKIATGTLLAVPVAVGLGWIWWKHHLKVDAAQFAKKFAAAVSSADSDVFDRHLLAPAMFSQKSPPERRQLILEYLDGEISPEGVDILTQDGNFGPLSQLFPSEAEAWAKASSVNVDECVAFRLDRGGYTAELVLHLPPDASYRLLRCNDIRQLAFQP